MKNTKFTFTDVKFIAVVIAFFTPFFIFDSLYQLYVNINQEHGFVMSFIQFGLLSTLGEVIGLRIANGVYNAPSFGILPRAIVWGVLGIVIKIAFIIFVSGAPNLLGYMGLSQLNLPTIGALSLNDVLLAFSISLTVNLIFAPLMMTIYSVFNLHITHTGGTLSGFFSKINYAKILTELNWDIQWNFVLKKTIPFFWIPAHTITFLLPADFQILFSAVLGIVLGTILALSASSQE